MSYRSALYVPASNLRALEKARSIDADTLIIDLEDAVAPEDKDTARAGLAAVLATPYPMPVLVRVNAVDTAWGLADLGAVRTLPVAGVVVPKVRTTADLPDLLHPLWLMIETSQAVLNLASLAADDRVAGLILGLNDLSLETGITDRAAFMPVIVQAVLAARAYGRIVLDGVCNSLDDALAIETEAAQARAWGCDGKTLIHPNQIVPTHAAFTASAAERDQAQRLIAAYEAAGGGAVRFEGKMIEALHVAAARRVLGS